MIVHLLIGSEARHCAARSAGVADAPAEPGGLLPTGAQAAPTAVQVRAAWPYARPVVQRALMHGQLQNSCTLRPTAEVEMLKLHVASVASKPLPVLSKQQLAV